MRSIHDDSPGSPSATQDQALALAQALCASLALRKDELDIVLAIARLGFCRIDGATRALQANSQFKAEFGWPPDALPDYRDLVSRIADEYRDVLIDMLETALREGGDLDLLVQTRWPGSVPQSIALRGRSVHDGGGASALFLTSRNVSVEAAAAATQVRRQIVDFVDLNTARDAAFRGLERFFHGMHRRGIRASAGAAVFPGDGADPVALFHAADGALYRAKQAGKNCYLFYDAIAEAPA